MTVEEIFSNLSAHMIKGLMIHDQMANYYDFLGLHGFKRCHEYHYHKESTAYRELCGYYINHYSKLVPEKRIEDPNIIPDSWYKYSRQDVDINTKRNAVKEGIEKWVAWERETKKLYQDSYIELLDANEIDAAAFIEKMICDVSRELKHSERKHIYYMSANFDMSVILPEQKCMHDKYKKKLRK